ncbi:MAG: hypothetical protein KDE27_20340 [Planctomycetes bacterium]|nr:hypothetical protein [Planctomycetota bacterium]
MFRSHYLRSVAALLVMLGSLFATGLRAARPHQPMLPAHAPVLEMASRQLSMPCNVPVTIRFQTGGSTQKWIKGSLTVRRLNGTVVTSVFVPKSGVTLWLPANSRFLFDAAPTNTNWQPKTVNRPTPYCGRSKSIVIRCAHR